MCHCAHALEYDKILDHRAIDSQHREQVSAHIGSGNSLTCTYKAEDVTL